MADVKPPRASSPHESTVAQLANQFVAFSLCRADLLFELDDSKKIKFAAGTTNRILNRSPAELSGTPFLDLVDHADRPMIDELLSKTIQGGRLDDIGFHLRLQNGSSTFAALAGYRVPDFDNHFFLAVKVSPRSLTPKKNLARDKDSDTKILNKSAFAEKAADRIRTLEQSGQTAKITYVKLDNLNELQNDLDDAAQSKILQTIGSILSSHSVGGDSAGRIDEENFAFVHTGDVNVSDVTRQIEAEAKSIHPDGIQIASKTATVHADAKDMTEAQMAKAVIYSMQEFVRKGGEMEDVNLSEVLAKQVKDTMAAVSVFERVCATRDFDLVYMPIRDLKTQKLHHVEALTRFRTGGKSPESPYRMITLAEEVGIISKFDLAVARKVIDFVSKRTATARPIAIAINVSGFSISNNAFVEEMHELLRRVNNLTDFVHLEITESSKIEDLEGVNTKIQGFRRKGFEVALDDFGAGAASFDYLNSFDVDTVKFDGPVVRRAYQSKKGRAFLSSMTSLCKEVQVQTIAEMVEDKLLGEFLRDIGVDLGQGYYFGKPTPDIDSFAP
jgi:EAL domain-containing protein (putative c-di-GMP-specific phosphodiesterase class I)/GGDEF domain-containing protein